MLKPCRNFGCETRPKERRFGAPAAFRLAGIVKRLQIAPLLACAARARQFAKQESSMKNNALSGAALAVAAVSLALAGAVTTATAATTGKVHCLGVNSCKGKSDCHSPKNACKGMNACKGQGWNFEESAKACEDAGGKVHD
jgi:uncharacterized membrane protein